MMICVNDSFVPYTSDFECYNVKGISFAITIVVRPSCLPIINAIDSFYCTIWFSSFEIRSRTLARISTKLYSSIWTKKTRSIFISNKNNLHVSFSTFIRYLNFEVREFNVISHYFFFFPIIYIISVNCICLKFNYMYDNFNKRPSKFVSPLFTESEQRLENSKRIIAFRCCIVADSFPRFFIIRVRGKIYYPIHVPWKKRWLFRTN